MELDQYVLKLIGAGAALTATTAAWYMLSRPKPFNPNVDFTHQSYDALGTERAKIGRLAEDGKPVTYMEEDVRTLHEAFKRGAQVSNNGKSLGWKPSATEPYKWISFNDVLTKASNVGAGLISAGMLPGNSTHIGIYCQNRPEYFIVEHACYMYSMVIVPLYDTLGVEACNWIINQAGLSLIVCDNNEKAKNMLGRMKETPNLRTIIVMETISTEIHDMAQTAGVTMLQYADIEAKGEESPQEPLLCKPKDLAVICYTSGTTGLPKGAICTHENILATSLAIVYVFNQTGLDVTNDDTYVSYLPLAHSYERACQLVAYSQGMKIGFFQGDIRKLMDDIKELKPTVFASVPRLLNRVYDKVMAGVSGSAVKTKLLQLALASKEKDLRRGIIRNDTIWDKLVFSKVQQNLGGRLRFISTGSAPLSPKILTFLRCCVGCPVVEGYGQTECSAVCCMQMIGDGEAGHVGPPLRCNYIKLADVPDMGYKASEDKGEVCIKGPNVFAGYYNDPEKTKEALDADGWLHTGDVGTWLPNGCLKLIDRKKNIFKLAQGEYIAPEKIENVYIRCPLVAQVYVHGDSLQACLLAVVVPDVETLPKFAKDKFNLEGDMTVLCNSEDVKKEILADMQGLGKKSGLQSFEQVKDIYLCPEMFSVENNLISPTFKTKRFELKKYFAKELEAMYSKM